MATVRTIPLTARTFELSCDLIAAADACLQARDFLAETGWSGTPLDEWELVIGEAINNAVENSENTLSIRVDLFSTREYSEVRVTDHTPGFDYDSRNLRLPPEDSESGRGMMLIGSLTDESKYLRGKEENCLILRRNRASSYEVAPQGQADPKEAQELAEARQTLDLMTEELASTYESLAAIFRFSSELHHSTDSDAFLQRWVGQLPGITEADWCVLRLATPDGKILRFAGVFPPSAEGTSRESLDLSEPTAVEARAANQRVDVWFDAEMLTPEDPLKHLVDKGCGISHPLFTGEVLIGVLSVGRLNCNAFTAGQVSIIQTLGDFLGIQIHRRRMLEERVQARLNAQELEIAANIQRLLLPGQLPCNPVFKLASFYRSALDISGDYYDAIPVGQGDILLVVADVMGKGLPAALFAFMFRSLVRAGAAMASRPGEFMSWLNRNLFQELDRVEMFITVQLTYLDAAKNEIRVSSAGHSPLLLADLAGNVVEIPAGGPPLGLAEGFEFPESSHSSKGTRGLMYTDGLYEAHNPEGELLGLDIVKASLAEAARARESADGIKQRMVDLLLAFERTSAPADDTALLVITG